MTGASGVEGTRIPLHSLSCRPSAGRSAGSFVNTGIMEAFRGTRPGCLPVWFMRQAGRSLPEYRAVRGTNTLLEACLNPDLACEITLQPVRRYSVDAAILFSDIVVPLKLAGVGVDILPGTGPVLNNPIDTPDRVNTLLAKTADSIDFGIIAEITRHTVSALNGIPLIGFAGAPYTLACYMVEGGPSKTHMKARAMMHGDKKTWQKVMMLAARLSGQFLAAQITSGAQAVQIFDSWAGSLSRKDYVDNVAPFSKMTIDLACGIDGNSDLSKTGKSIWPRVPVLHFAANAGHLLTAIRDIGVSVMSVDYTKPLDEASELLDDSMPLQGNIDPAMLFAPWEVLKRHVLDIVQRASRAPSHVLNLGHGVPPDASCDQLARIVDLAHSMV
ncbi:uroporphyrinogen decarboxylase [Tropheryma whipplei]|uniref:uroporphyrinogen decarboxylase n=1 Tax=Tropheryma whipplei TaxID=2039 RepID=UPI0004B541F7|nr:uroporphyrinogen decarboxylase [Tropheryma whipplei]